MRLSKFADSPAEQGGIELLVSPRSWVPRRSLVSARARRRRSGAGSFGFILFWGATQSLLWRGTDGSNLSPSSVESGANLAFCGCEDVRHQG
jgi:hypothetical protein